MNMNTWSNCVDLFNCHIFLSDSHCFRDSQVCGNPVAKMLPQHHLAILQ
jgi:hypothetical protein